MLTYADVCHLGAKHAPASHSQLYIALDIADQLYIALYIAGQLYIARQLYIAPASLRLNTQTRTHTPKHRAHLRLRRYAVVN
jgi:hypothetical protein